MQRQIGPGGPTRSFVDEPEKGLMARARIIDVEPWYSVVRDPALDDDPENEIRNIPKRRVVDYGAEGALWSTTKVAIEISDAYGEPNFDARRVTAEARGVVEDFERYVGADVIVGAGRGLEFYATNGVFGLEWQLSLISPINDDGTVSWPDDIPVGRSSTIDAFEKIAHEGEIVVTADDSNPPEVVERRPKEGGGTPAPSRTPPRGSP